MLVVLAWLILVGLVIGFVVHCVRHPGALKRTWTSVDVMPTWGTVAMGMMSAGAGLLTVFPQVNHGFVVT